MSIRHNREWRGSIKLLALGVAVGLCLFADSLAFSPTGLFASIFRETAAVLQNPEIQWVVFLCFGIYCVAFMILRSGAVSGFWLMTNPDLWLIGMLVISAVVYAIKYCASFSALTLLGGAMLGMWAGFLKTEKLDPRPCANSAAGRPKGGKQLIPAIVAVIAILLTFPFIWNLSASGSFRYQGSVRWSGPWHNPNIYGLLAGVGAVLNLGQVVRGGIGNSSIRCRRLIATVAWLVATILCGVGLFKSYSRGAWVATLVGTCYLLHQKQKFFKCLGSEKTNSTSVWKLYGIENNKWRLLAVITISFLIFGFWQFRFTEWLPAKRVFSVANVNDFSWRNRVSAWMGAFRMMKDRPLIGFGWGSAESVYVEKYCPTQLGDGSAIQMNDYFMLGISAGVPALLCFLFHVGLCLRTAPAHSELVTLQNIDAKILAYELFNLEWLKAVCRAGVVVLLIGFWFDGGLFKLATGSVFWILLELGRTDITCTTQAATQSRLKKTDHPSETGTSPKRKPLEIWLRRTAWTLAAAASLETIVFIGTPLFSVNNQTLAIARKWLVPPKAVQDLDFLATGPEWHGKKLRVLLQHASLANYNRQLLNWTLDDQVYRDFVLTPTIDLERDGGLFWRRNLWEYFYPPIRKENNPQAGAQIVLRYLRGRIDLVSDGPRTIEEMWNQKKADKVGFEALEVASFRSVGIPARLNETGQAEIYSNAQWKVIQPLVGTSSTD